MRFSIRFDFRSPGFAEGTTADRYAAALDMAAWADRRGCSELILSEHHGSADGYLPSPLPMLAAMAARTERLALRVAAMVGPFHDPLRLAEDLVVVDNLSRGRLDVVVGVGYVASEFAMFGVDRSERVRRVSELVGTLLVAVTGEPFEYRGRTVRITPGPCRPGGPPIALGGGTPKAARRAARLGAGFEPAGPGLWEEYRAETVRLGRPEPAPKTNSSAGVVWVAERPEEAWDRLAPFLLHEMNSYGRWIAEAAGESAHFRLVEDVAALRATNRYRILTPDELVAEARAHPERLVALSPLCGGAPIGLAWEGLELIEREVLPAFAAERPRAAG